MTISEALIELETCRWLKITASHITATRYKTHEQLVMLTRKEWDSGAVVLYAAKVQTRRKKGESFEDLLIRAAQMIKAGHLPTVRVPPLTITDRCACGAESHDLVWNEELKQRMCRSCVSAWMSAAAKNDIGPLKSPTVQ